MSNNALIALALAVSLTNKKKKRKQRFWVKEWLKKKKSL